MSKTTLIGLFLLRVLFFATPSSACPPGICDLVGSWKGRDTAYYITFHDDATFTGQLLGLYVSGLAVVNVGVSPLTIDLHVNTGSLWPAIYRIEVELDGTVVLVLGLVENLLDLILGLVLRPLGFTPLNSLYFVKGLPVVGILDAPPHPSHSNSTVCPPTLSCGDCGNRCTQLCQQLQQKGKTCSNKCQTDMCKMFCA
jgi:hypothetical protein